MTKKQLKETIEALTVQYPTKQVLLLAKCEDSLVHKESPLWMKDDYIQALRFIRYAPDCELHYAVVEQDEVDEKRFRIVYNQLLIPKKPKAKIDAYYARNSDNLKYTDDDYEPLSTDVLELSGTDSILMSELVLYASRTFGQTTFSTISKQKIYKHLATGVMYCLSANFHVKNFTRRVATGETAFTGKPTKLEVYINQKSDNELTDIGFVVHQKEYKVAKRKHSIGDFLSHN